MLNLHASPLSPFSQKVHFFLEETGIPYQYHVVNLGAGEQTREPFLSLNPFGRVPAIERSGFTLSESNAILRYLAQRYEKNDWYPVNLEDRARVDMLVDFTNLHLNRWIVSLAWHRLFGPKFFGQPTDQRVVDEADANAHKGLAKLERYLLERTYLAGATPTIADACFMPFAALAAPGQVALTDYPRVAAYVERMTSRPAWRKILAEQEKILARI